MPPQLEKVKREIRFQDQDTTIPPGGEYDLATADSPSENLLFDEIVEKVYPAEILMIGGCRDSQISVEVDAPGASLASMLSSGGETHHSKEVSINLSQLRNTHFRLPNNIDGRSSGVCTKAFLSCLQGNHATVSWFQLLKSMRAQIHLKGYNQDPQLSSSRLIEVDQPFEIVRNKNGTKRAVMIGVNYTGQKGELSGCHDDVESITSYLIESHGFEKENMTVLMDDGIHEPPTYRNIMVACRAIVRESKPGDTVFFHYSGHGGRIQDINKDEADGFDETIIPSDYFRAGQITDDDLNKTLVKPMKKGVYVVALMDCCHSGTVLDLPYVCTEGSHMTRQTQLNLDLKKTKFCGFFYSCIRAN
eukprot:CAMPEP_0203674784 /NCGR_PEP_ID=MMETSP0090-20130426/17287_1 /ASSEMBLY_ACC=CAM_ASM_001088 /TAXON_ID=426623 /ORGANISM="Chaetoceros affinis, Strain CCMP159" /LENGTH=360 /DNA_ID=CAMNT_0050540751 /DNA_START=42 /DNA_END=1124 /DNA_ORIENTATION=+